MSARKPRRTYTLLAVLYSLPDGMRGFLPPLFRGARKVGSVPTTMFRVHHLIIGSGPDGINSTGGVSRAYRAKSRVGEDLTLRGAPACVHESWARSSICERVNTDNGYEKSAVACICNIRQRKDLV